MSTDSDEIVSLCLSTRDDTLVEEFVSGLNAQGLDNTVEHVTTGAEAFAFVSAQPRKAPYVVLLDIRELDTDALNFLAEVEQRGGNNPAVIVIIADHEDNMDSVSKYKHMIAGRIPSADSATEFLNLVAEVLSSNWSVVEPQNSPTEDDAN